MRKKFVVTLLITALLSVLVLATQTASSQNANSHYTIGVKSGDWIEYNVTTTGAPPAEKHIDWARMEVIDVEGDSFHVNSTGHELNGTYSSFIRTFNFTAGEVSAWIIIPANLSPGETFYDSYDNANYAIQGEQQETIAGASRTITYINDTERYKQWDKETGVFVETIDNVGNYTVNAKAYATNMWSPQIIGIDQNVFYAVVVAVIVVIVAAVLVVIYARRKK
jgi:hypothetical protein